MHGVEAGQLIEGQVLSQSSTEPEIHWTFSDPCSEPDDRAQRGVFRVFRVLRVVFPPRGYNELSACPACVDGGMHLNEA